MLGNAIPQPAMHASMNTSAYVLALAAALSLAGCASQKPASAPAQASAPATPSAATGKGRAVKSRDGKFEGEVIGQPRAGSKFATLQIGMQMSEVQNVFGRAPDRLHTYESGKRWIPFYFGNDARRMQALYRGEGCLVFSDGNAWGGAGGDLVSIEHDPSGNCYQP
jgi:hypothetical protein